MKFKSSIARAAMTALFLGASAQATILNEFSDIAAWTAATTGPVTSQTFNLPTSGVASQTYQSVTYAGFYNENSNGGSETYLWNAPSAGFQTGTGGYIMGGAINSFLNGDGTNNTGIRATLNSLSGITALAFNFSAFRFNASNFNTIYSTGGAPIVLSLDIFENGAYSATRSLTVPTGTLGLGFFGFTTDGNITGIKISMNAPSNTIQNRVVLDNFAYAAATVQSGGGGEPTSGEIPEPTTYLLCAAGLLGVAVFRRTKSR